MQRWILTESLTGHSLLVLLHLGKGSQMSVELCLATQRVLGYRSICATSQWLCSRWHLCFLAVSGRGKLLWVFTVMTMHLFVVSSKSVVLWFTHAAQKLDYTFRPADSHQHYLVAKQDFQGHKHQDLTGATDHLVPHSEKDHLTWMKNLIWGRFITKTSAIQQLYINL